VATLRQNRETFRETYLEALYSQPENQLINKKPMSTPNDKKQQALDYHSQGKPGKLAIQVTKPCDTQKDLSLAYTPGVAEPVRAIAADAHAAYQYTAKGNLVAVITDGSAVLGLGNVGALAGKPVMEGKAVLFKRFADIDVFDIEVNARSSEDFIQTVTNIAPTFGGINLEDIASPQCFEIEKALVEQLDIPVFHDDQHGTAIIICAGLLNALELQGKALPDVKLVCLGAGAAAIASMRLLVSLGANKDNIHLVDRKGVIHSGRDDLNVYKQEFALQTHKRTLADAMQGADVFIGLSGPNLVSADMVASMADKPVVFALSNPDPEIAYEVATAVRQDMIIATGRSDYPNQVNNVLGFPYIFRGALDVHAKDINEAMKIAAVKALAALTREPVPPSVLTAYGVEHMEFGPQYIIPKPFDPRLRDYIPPAIAQAAVDSGAARVAYPKHYPPAPKV
jgi:malate dehydrogenase (oxaloacetate-decarboxylating)(NADP+)